MSAPSPFDVSRAIGNNISSAFTKIRDENAIENILSQASQSGDPEQLQGAIGKILSQVSPERQPNAIKYLENAYNNVQKKQQMEQRKLAEIQAGVTPGLDPRIQAVQYKEGAKGKRIEDANKVFSPQGISANIPVDVEGTQAPTQNVPISTDIEQKKTRLLALTGHPDREIAERAKAELKNIEATEREDRADIREAKKETLPLKKEIIDRANASRESIRNKNHLIGLIDSGKLDDPTFAIFAENLPLGLGKRLLSPETVEYKGGLVDEFSDLKNIFKGATRVKEVEIYENKLADIYLTDIQKKAILKSRINTAKVDLIREEAAAEVERLYPNTTALQFNQMVDKLAEPKVNELFNSIWDEQKHVFDQAEKRKNIPLDANDPDDIQIIDQILEEAGGNYIEAEKLAKKKGYKF